MHAVGVVRLYIHVCPHIAIDHPKFLYNSSSKHTYTGTNPAAHESAQLLLGNVLGANGRLLPHCLQDCDHELLIILMLLLNFCSYITLWQLDVLANLAFVIHQTKVSILDIHKLGRAWTEEGPAGVSQV